MILADQHTHSNFSTDSEATPESMVLGAIDAGLTGLTLTDHMDMDYPGTTKEKPLFEFNPADYFAALAPLKKKYSDKLYLGIGVELGLRPGREDLNHQMHSLLSDYPFDFVLGSVHLLDNDDPYYEAYWQGRLTKDIMTKYFNDMLAALKEYDNFFDKLEMDDSYNLTTRKRDDLNPSKIHINNISLDKFSNYTNYFNGFDLFNLLRLNDCDYGVNKKKYYKEILDYQICSKLDVDNVCFNVLKSISKKIRINLNGDCNIIANSISGKTIDSFFSQSKKFIVH
jgi:hypothetical protein